MTETRSLDRKEREKLLESKNKKKNGRRREHDEPTMIGQATDKRKERGKTGLKSPNVRIKNRPRRTTDN